jgi:hypothetical protein
MRGVFFWAGAKERRSRASGESRAQGGIRRSGGHFLKDRAGLPIIVKFIKSQLNEIILHGDRLIMLKSIGKPSLLLKLGSLRCVCMPNRLMDDALRTRIRPLVFGGFAWWCDKA